MLLQIIPKSVVDSVPISYSKKCEQVVKYCRSTVDRFRFLVPQAHRTLPSPMYTFGTAESHMPYICHRKHKVWHKHLYILEIWRRTAALSRVTINNQYLFGHTDKRIAYYT